MTSEPVLLMGGTGAIGRLSALALRAVHPDVPFLIGGRDLRKSREVASKIGHAVPSVRTGPTPMMQELLQ